MSAFHPIGEPFRFDGTTLIAQEQPDNNCNGCYLLHEWLGNKCQSLQCTSGIRADGKSVIFDEMFPQ